MSDELKVFFSIFSDFETKLQSDLDSKAVLVDRTVHVCSLQTQRADRPFTEVFLCAGYIKAVGVGKETKYILVEVLKCVGVLSITESPDEAKIKALHDSSNRELGEWRTRLSKLPVRVQSGRWMYAFRPPAERLCGCGEKDKEGDYNEESSDKEDST